MTGPTIISTLDDALSAIRVLDRDNTIILFTPRSTDDKYPFQALVDTITTTYDKTVFAMEYADTFDTRHKNALGDQAAAAVIVVVREDSQKSFAKKVWDAGCEEEEVAGVLVRVGGEKRALGGFRTVVHAENLSDKAQVAVAKCIFG